MVQALSTLVLLSEVLDGAFKHVIEALVVVFNMLIAVLATANCLFSS